MKTINKIILILLSILSFSCEDIFEEDITNDTVEIISPIEGEVIKSNVVNFHWNILKGANKYRVQVYDSNQTVVLDSLVNNKISLTYPLSAGVYEWSVSGENFGYQSVYSLPVKFSVESSDDLTNQVVILMSPTDNNYLNIINVTLNWQSILNATNYSVEVVNIDNNQSVYTNLSVVGTSVTLNIPTLLDGNYEWRVKAKNATTETLNFSSRRFHIDRISPNQPQNNLPANNSLTLTANQAITFSWTLIADTGVIQSPISYTVEFSNTNTFSTIIRTINSSTTSSLQTFTSTGDYYWRVKAIDSAGNNSAFTTPFMFKIN
jgi:hypothetical protein